MTVGQQNINTNNNAVGVSSDSPNASTIVFDGSSTVNGTVGAVNPLLAIQAGVAGDTVNFQGNVNSAVLNVTGTGSVNFDGTTNAAATFGADGTIGLAPGTTYDGAVSNLVTNTGTLSLGSASILNGAVGTLVSELKAIDVVGGSNTVGVSAAINGAVAANTFNLGLNTLNLNGALTIGTSGNFVVSITPSLVGSINAAGHNVNLTGANVVVQVTPLSAITKTTTYTIVNAGAGTSGVPVLVSLTNALARDPTGFDLNGDIFITVDPGLLSPSLPASANGNQRSVSGGIDNAILGGANLNSAFSTLLGYTGSQLTNALTQLSGEPATDVGKGAFQLMTDLLNLMLDPTAGGGSPTGGGATGFAPEDQASLPPEIASAYASALKKQPQPQQKVDQRWTAWGSAFGGSSTINGNAALGSNSVTASDYGFAAGMTYNATPQTAYGFALAGGGTNWGVAQGLGGGRSDSFQAGVYGTTHMGPTYLSGALAFANHWFTTNRIALGDQLTANFDGQSYAARGEAGYRYALPIDSAIIGVTPYAALQVQDFHTPGYSETDLTGGGFGLSYAALNATDTRSELGARFDNLQILDNMPLVLRARLAWAHDWVSNSTLGAVFQALPGSNFTVNGATPPADSVLTTAAAELHMTANWTLIAKFDGEFASTAQTYAGTGTLRYTW